MISIGIFLIAVLTFIAGRLNILQHILRNFEEYYRKHMRENEDEFGAQIKFLKLCIKDHQDIIRYEQKKKIQQGSIQDIFLDLLES